MRAAAAGLSAALRSEGTGPGSGRGLMVLAIGTAVAALRGMTGWLADRRQKFQDLAPVRQAAAKAKAEKTKRRAEHEAALAQIGGDAEKARAKGRLQSLTDAGRGAAKGGGPGGKGSSGASGGRGTTKPGPPGTVPGGKSGPGKGGPTGSGKPPSGSGSAGGGKSGPKPGSTSRDTSKDGPGRGIKSPAGGKSPGSSTSSPSVERVRGRQQRAADRQAARLEDRAKNQHAARERKNSSRDSEQAVKDKIRNRRLKDKARRKDKARAKARKGREKDAAGRTTFGQAVTEGAQERLEKRRKNLSPVLSKAKKAQKATKASSAKGPTTPTPPPPGPTKPPKSPKSRKSRKNKSTPPPPGPAGPPPGPGGSRPGSRSRSNRRQQPPPRQEPRADGEWLRPPPGMSARYSVTLTRLDRPEKPRREAVAGALSGGGFPAGSQGAALPPASSGAVPGPRKGAPPVGTPAVPDTQFADSDLTVYDVIEADQDQAAEIMAGAEHAKLVAERCERLAGAIEALRSDLIAKSVPGVLVGWCTRLIERAQVVEGKAHAVAAGLPRASEAIAHAGQVAADYDKPAADTVRDLGHTAPADASYHKE